MLLAVAARVMIMSPNGVEAGGMPPPGPLALRQWLSTTAGLFGVKLESASELCEREEITSLADLRRLHTKGNLPQVGFKFLTLDMITEALEKIDTPADTGVGGNMPSADEAECSETQAVEQSTEQNERGEDGMDDDDSIEVTGDTAVKIQAKEEKKAEGEKQGTRRGKHHDMKRTKLQNGVEKEIISPGDGSTFPKKGDQLKMQYIGKLGESWGGKIFDSSTAFTFTVGTGKVIKGWDIGCMTMSLGEKAILYIPAEQGYGAAGAGDGVIPGGADLTFEIDLLQVSTARGADGESGVDAAGEEKVDPYPGFTRMLSTAQSAMKEHSNFKLALHSFWPGCPRFDLRKNRYTPQKMVFQGMEMEQTGIVPKQDRVLPASVDDLDDEYYQTNFGPSSPQQQFKACNALGSTLVYYVESIEIKKTKWFEEDFDAEDHTSEDDSELSYTPLRASNSAVSTKAVQERAAKTGDPNLSSRVTGSLRAMLRDAEACLRSAKRGSADRGVESVFDPPPEHLLTSFHTILIVEFSGHPLTLPSF